MILECTELPYEARPEALGLTTLETRRGDLIEVSKILKGVKDVDSGKFFSMSDSLSWSQ